MASMNIQKHTNMNHGDSASETDSHSNHSAKNGHSVGDKNTADNPKRKKLIKYGNQMDRKSNSRRKQNFLELPKLMFTNYIPNAADIFQWVRNTSIHELRNLPKTQTSFPMRGVTIH